MPSRPQLNTTARITGLATELHVRAELTYLGFLVFVTDHPYTRADLVIELADQLIRLQVKSMVWRERDSHYRVHPEDPRRASYQGRIDFFVFNVREENEYFVVPNNVASAIGEITWRPAHFDKQAGGRRPKFDGEKYRNAWHLLYEHSGHLPSAWQHERMAKWNQRRTCHCSAVSTLAGSSP